MGLTNLGLKCVGPSILKREIDEPCPNSAIIDLDTARLLTKKRHASNSHRLHLDCRCITCHAEYRVRECVAKSSLHLQVPGYLCTRPGCSRPCVDGTAGCDLHLWGLSFDPPSKSTSDLSRRRSKRQLAQDGLLLQLTTYYAKDCRISEMASDLPLILSSSSSVLALSRHDDQTWTRNWTRELTTE